MTVLPASLVGPWETPYPTAKNRDQLRREARAQTQRHARIWGQRALTRLLYRSYFDMMNASRSKVSGRDLEIGSGPGHFKAYSPKVIATDLIHCPWHDCTLDANRLPFRDHSLANVVMIDVLHHLAKPARFLSEASRTLAPGGRILLIEPYVSPISRLGWYFHPEELDMNVDPLADNGPQTSDDPWDSNIASPTRLFWRGLNEFHRRFDRLRVVQRKRFDTVLMPLSGGFGRRRLVPMSLVPLVRAFEKLIKPLNALLAFRCFVVIEKT